MTCAHSIVHNSSIFSGVAKIAAAEIFSDEAMHTVHRAFDRGCIIDCRSKSDGGAGLSQRYTRREVGRILGVNASRLEYWERLRLVRPRARWGERFYSFGDLVSLRTMKRLTDRHIPARRVLRAINLVEQQFGAAPLALHQLQFIEQGRDVMVIPPGESRPFNPRKQQWGFSFESASPQRKLRRLSGPTAEDLFRAALECEADQETLPEAVTYYRQTLEISPDWVEAHINLGVALYQIGDADAARAAFLKAVQLDPWNGICRYNLGCVLEEQGEIDEAIRHLRCAARVLPNHADSRFNLALAYEKRGQRRLAREQWTLYLRHAPNGPWADQARAHLKRYETRRKLAAPIPFPRKA
ncbi:MAG: tetratricopeptide repeat protein [Candidatus Acidiferrales bacterium]